MSDVTARGARAKLLLESADFKDIMRVLKAETLQAWADTASSTAERREELYRDIQAIDRFEKRLQRLVDDGTMAARKET